MANSCHCLLPRTLTLYERFNKYRDQTKYAGDDEVYIMIRYREFTEWCETNGYTRAEISNAKKNNPGV